MKHADPPRTRAVVAITTTLALALSGCGIVSMTHNTRYFVTEKQAGGTVQLHRGDEVTFNLPIRGDADWTAVSGDRNIARPIDADIMMFSNGERARLMDFGLVGTGHVTLTACPSHAETCSPSTPGAISVAVDVT